jgi:Flp pilus assembly protein TadG
MKCPLLVMCRVTRNLRSLADDVKASQVAEAALVFPLVFMMLLGIYWFGRAFNIYATINHAAREGAHVAVLRTCATCGNQPTPTANVANVVAQALQASSVDPAQVLTYNPNNNAANFCGGTVQCATGGVNNTITVCSNVILTPNSPQQVCGVSVSFEYPYQFWLPFTSLNQQQFMLKADVQMKGEY